MIVLIDNYDSFSYNLYQLIGSVEPDVKVVRNDAYTVEEIEAMKPEAIILLRDPENRPMQESVLRRSGILPERFRSLVCVWDIRQSAKHLMERCPMRKN